MSELVREWIDCNSPLLLVARDHLIAWEGTNVPSNGRKVEACFRWNPDGPATDYDRACDIDDYVGVIDVGNGKGIVLGEEPLMTTWRPFSDGGLLVRWVFAESEEDLISSALNIPIDDYEDSGVSLRISSSSLVLFAACESSEDELYSRIGFEMALGDYKILTCKHDSEQLGLISHRLRRESA